MERILLIDECSHLLEAAVLSIPQLERAAAGTEQGVPVHSKGGDGVVVRGIECAGGVLWEGNKERDTHVVEHRDWNRR